MSYHNFAFYFQEERDIHLKKLEEMQNQAENTFPGEDQPDKASLLCMRECFLMSETC